MKNICTILILIFRNTIVYNKKILFIKKKKKFFL